MVEAQTHIVIDNGTGYMKGGFSGENAPKAVFPTLIGIPKEGKLLTDKNMYNDYSLITYYDSIAFTKYSMRIIALNTITNPHYPVVTYFKKKK